jgi:hypothetical protein
MPRRVRNTRPCFGRKNLMFPGLTVFLFRPIILVISSWLEGALPGTLWNVGVGAAPAGVGRTSLCALGGPWVTVRAHYGALPSVAGRDRRRVGESLPGWRACSRLRPEVRSQGRRSRRDGTSRGVAVCLCFPAIRESSRGCYQGAPFGVPPPSFLLEGGSLDPPFTRRHLRAAMTLARRKERREMHKRAPHTPSYAGLTRVSIHLRKTLSKRMNCRVKPGNDGDRGGHQ